jgi:paraquat-inducible protein A
MVEVFLLGVFVAYTRLRAIASVDIDPGLIALFGVMLAMVAADATLDRHAVWKGFDRSARRVDPARVSEGALVACHVCSRVSRAPEGATCARCRHPLHRRKPHSVRRATAFMLAAAVLYIPANALPVMSVTRFGRGGPHTILGGVIELFDDHLWPLAIIVFFASIVIPIAKLGALAVMLVTTHRRSGSRLALRTRVFRVIAVVGRWSMIDIFALATLVAIVHMGWLATVVPGDGAIAFAGVVVLTMIATECFDPRLMWDAAEGSSHGVIRVAPGVALS